MGTTINMTHVELSQFDNKLFSQYLLKFAQTILCRVPWVGWESPYNPQPLLRRSLARLVYPYV